MRKVIIVAAIGVRLIGILIIVLFFGYATLAQSVSPALAVELPPVIGIKIIYDSPPSFWETYQTAWSTILSAFLGFGGLIIITAMGLRQSRKSQRTQAELDRNLQKKQWQEDHKLADLARDRERETIYCAIAADLDALLPSLTGFRDALAEANQVKGLLPGKNVFLAMRHVIWESCAPKIGLLDPNHAANVVETYRFIDALAGRVEAMDLDIKDHRDDLRHLTNTVIININKVLKNLPVRPDRPSVGSQ